MSLKAKIEAVIYASEEPVTLLQLVGLLALEAQAELDRLDGRQQSLPMQEAEAESALEADAANVETLPEAGEAEAQPAVTPELSADEPVAEARLESRESAAEKRIARERERRLREFFRQMLDELIRDYQIADRGIEVREVAGGFRMGTKPEYHDAVRGFVRSLKPPLKLSLQALETLAVVAYKQPVTAPEVSEIRGVDSGGVLGSLMGRKLITTAGRKQVIGRPILYKTTKDFLLRFGLKDVAELPSIEEFEKMAVDMIEQEEIAMPETKAEARPEQASSVEGITHENLREEAEATLPQADGDGSALDPAASNEAGDDLPAIDGRISGPPPSYDRASDPSAEEAAIQSGAPDS